MNMNCIHTPLNMMFSHQTEQFPTLGPALKKNTGKSDIKPNEDIESQNCANTVAKKIDNQKNIYTPRSSHRDKILYSEDSLIIHKRRLNLLPDKLNQILHK